MVNRERGKNSIVLAIYTPLDHFCQCFFIVFSALDALRKKEISANKAAKVYKIPSSTLYKIARKEGIELAQPFNAVATTWNQASLVTYMTIHICLLKKTIILIFIRFQALYLAEQINEDQKYIFLTDWTVDIPP